MAKTSKEKTFTVMRWYRVLQSGVVKAENLQQAAEKLENMGFDDFVSIEDTEKTDEETIFKS